MRIACATALGFLLVGPLSAAEVKGVPRIVDADTVYVGTQKIRFSGIDAPETNQICLDARWQSATASHRWFCNAAEAEAAGCRRSKL